MMRRSRSCQETIIAIQCRIWGTPFRNELRGCALQPADRRLCCPGSQLRDSSVSRTEVLPKRPSREVAPPWSPRIYLFPTRTAHHIGNSAAKSRPFAGLRRHLVFVTVSGVPVFPVQYG